MSPPKNETELIQELVSCLEHRLLLRSVLISHMQVLQFLQHDGYVETARAFAEEIHAEKQALNIDSNVPVEGININDDEDAHRRQRTYGHKLPLRYC